MVKFAFFKIICYYTTYVKKGSILMEKYYETDTTIEFKSEDDLKELKEFKRNSYGRQSKLYYLKQGKELLKVYNKKVDTTADYVNFSKLKEIKTKTLVKIKKILLINNKYSGYSMDKITGPTYFNIDNDDIRDILESLIEVENDIIKLSKHNIVADDLNIGNIIYNRKDQQSNLIDVNSYIYMPYTHTETIRLNNCFNLYATIITALSKIPFYKETNITFFNYIKQAIFENDYESNIYDFFDYFITDLEDYTEEEIITVKDFAKVLRKSKDLY